MLCKLTKKDMTTYGGFKWTIGKWNKAARKDATACLCSDAYLHAYESPELAELLNPIGAGFDSPLAFKVTGVRGYTRDDRGLKLGVEEMRIGQAISLHGYTPAQKIAFAIYLALGACDEASFVEWAENWLSGKDRTEKAAEAAWAAEAAAWAAAVAAAEAAEEEAAWAAAKAAWAAAKAAWAAAEAAAKEAAWAAWAAAEAAAAEVALPMFIQICAEAAKDVE